MRATYLAVLGTVITIFSASANAASRSCEPVWQEEFDVPLDPMRWSIVEGDGCDINLCGWGNDERQTYSADAINVAEGALSVTAQFTETGSITSGKIVTAGKFSQRFGRFEARMKLPPGRGLWPAFWLMPDPHNEQWPLQGEIDILEWVGNDPHRIIGALHFGDVWPSNVHYSETLRTAGTWLGDYHTFGVVWAPGKIRWFVDGRVHAEATPEQVLPWPWVFDEKPFYIIVNMAVGGTLGGTVEAADYPASLKVDWIKVYDHSCDDDLQGG